jgi:hypothetical protein
LALKDQNQEQAFRSLAHDITGIVGFCGRQEVTENMLNAVKSSHDIVFHSENGSMVTIRQQLSKTVVSSAKKNTWSYQETKKERQVGELQ